jgi:hypothetical protein
MSYPTGCCQAGRMTSVETREVRCLGCLEVIGHYRLTGDDPARITEPSQLDLLAPTGVR